LVFLVSQKLVVCDIIYMVGDIYVYSDER
jgi:hypothetical protein